jgi:hypothetical protein
MLHENFVYVGAFIFVLGAITYIKDVISGKAKPNRATFILWSVAPLIAFFAELDEGVGIQSLMTFMVGFVPIMILVASLSNKKSYWQLAKLDYIFALLSVLGIVLWQITKVGTIAIVFSVLADALAAAPTVIKSYKFPESESSFMYFTAAISALLTLLTIKVWTFAHFGFPAYILLVNVLIAALVHFKLGKKLANTNPSTSSTT